MGSWGVKALESDEGLDILYEFQAFVREHPNVRMAALLESLEKGGWLPSRRDHVEFLFDKTAMALSELYVDFRDNGRLSVKLDDPVVIESFTAEAPDLTYLVDFLTDIRSGAPGEDGSPRETTALRKGQEEWFSHLDRLIALLKQ